MSSTIPPRLVGRAQTGFRPSAPGPYNSSGEYGRLPTSGGIAIAHSTAPHAASQLAASDLCIVPARAGDHTLIHQLLLSVFHGPSANEFQATLDDPHYEPADRLLTKMGDQILSHVRVTRREMLFGPLLVPITKINSLATWPEFKGLGYATSLLQAAEQRSIQAGAMLSMLRTKIPQFFEQAGWIVCGRHCFSRANARDVLSYFEAQRPDRKDSRASGGLARRLTERTDHRPDNNPESDYAHTTGGLSIRLWRQVEQDALMCLYRKNTKDAFGALIRNDAYWRWLISRRGYDRIYVAIDGPDKLDLQSATSPIVGYAVMKKGRIVELLGDPARPAIVDALLQRACADAIERDCHAVQLDSPPNSPLHRLMKASGGRHYWQEVDQDEVTMVKIFNPVEFLSRLCDLLNLRAKLAGLQRPIELGLLLGGEKYRLAFTKQTTRLESGKLGRSYLACSMATFTQLILGHRDVTASVHSGQITASTRVASQLARILFPLVPFWHPPLDELPG